MSATVTLERWGSGDLPPLERLMGDPRMTGHLGDFDLTRMTRSGAVPLSSQEGLALFDAAVTVTARPACSAADSSPVLLPMRLDLAAIAADPAGVVDAEDPRVGLARPDHVHIGDGRL